ncbi:MAG TPA: ferritin family protein [Candidatus Angelobacter sp.]|jgi:rubrerythrin|nr:ferritin family protein [Candidatus Angelobacter sp.]
MTRTFSSLSPQEALHVAIYIEERNAEVYQRFAEMFAEFRDPDSVEIADVFWDMSVEEKRHSILLQGKYRERYGEASCVLTEEDLHDMIEVPRLESSGVFEVVESVMASPRQRALRVAIDAEKSAQNFYAQLVQSTDDDALRNLYNELATMEDGHVTQLRSMMAVTAVAADKGVH